MECVWFRCVAVCRVLLNTLDRQPLAMTTDVEVAMVEAMYNVMIHDEVVEIVQ